MAATVWRIDGAIFGYQSATTAQREAQASRWTLSRAKANLRDSRLAYRQLSRNQQDPPLDPPLFEGGMGTGSIR